MRGISEESEPARRVCEPVRQRSNATRLSLHAVATLVSGDPAVLRGEVSGCEASERRFPARRGRSQVLGSGCKAGRSRRKPFRRRCKAFRLRCKVNRRRRGPSPGHFDSLPGHFGRGPGRFEMPPGHFRSSPGRLQMPPRKFQRSGKFPARTDDPAIARCEKQIRRFARDDRWRPSG